MLRDIVQALLGDAEDAKSNSCVDFCWYPLKLEFNCNFALF